MIILNKDKVEFGKFPNGESYLPIEDLYVRSYNKVVWVYEGDDEFFKLNMLKDWLDDELTKTAISINYMPHSRMDRVNSNYAMSLITATRMINSMGFDTVEVIEPHSDVTPALLDRSSSNEWCMEYLKQAIGLSGATSLFFPDAGAAKRYESALPYAVGFKQRDFETGTIIKFSLMGDNTDNVLIVDDLCSKGTTFIKSSELLKGLGAKKVSLLIAHCENTVFEGELFDHIDTLYTSNRNLLNKNHKQITLI